MKTVPVLVLATLLSVALSTRAAEATSHKPPASPAKSAKPSARGPGTQTEDELYIGAKARTPQKAKAKPAARARTGDEDLEDLEVQRFGSKAKSK